MRAINVDFTMFIRFIGEPVEKLPEMFRDVCNARENRPPLYVAFFVKFQS